MREIKFRAWYKGVHSGEMIYDIQNEFEERINLGMDSFGHYLNKDSFEVMQYTGLKDCKGKEIYEGDIAIVNNKIFKIVYSKGSFVIYNGNSNIHLIYDLNIEDNKINNMEVIGNIYENPELLK
ncbi:YopX family protein [Clostridium butyricum]|uniref:YopX family protein n=1 Tax=Clostridium butyricum TaxID=1492 RepID=UPI00325B3FD6